MSSRATNLRRVVVLPENGPVKLAPEQIDKIRKTVSGIIEAPPAPPRADGVRNETTTASSPTDSDALNSSPADPDVATFVDVLRG